MAKRLTDTDKYKDSWFLDLEPIEKLLFYYLIDNVDNAGFYEFSFRHIQFHLGINKDEILGATLGLARGLLGANENIKNGDKVYLKNFLIHQKIFPLNPFNSFHRHALKVFENNLDFVESYPFLTNLEVKGVKIKNGETIKKIESNLLKYLKFEKGLASPIVEVEVKGEEGIKEEGIVKVNFGKSENLLEMETLKTEMQKEFTWREKICRNVKEVESKFTPEDFDNYLEQFFKVIESDGEESKSIKETKKHFNRWLVIQIKNNNGNSTNKTSEEIFKSAMGSKTARNFKFK